jgi:NADPH:quinone reductase-like Zn-dependent oxidoreductase
VLAVTVTAAPEVALAAVAEPVPSPAEAIVRVRAFSLNRGEVSDLAGLTVGTVPGWDVAGVVLHRRIGGKAVLHVDSGGPGPGYQPTTRRSVPKSATISRRPPKALM